MKIGWLALAWAAPMILSAQTPTAAAKVNVMVVRVAHDNSIMGGGIGGSNFLKPGDASVQPIAWLTPSGDWLKVPCYKIGGPYDDFSDYSKPCHHFEREYLIQAHTYTVVSADGRGASVEVPHMNLDQECFGMGGGGTFTGGTIRFAAVAAESTDMFSVGEPARRMAGDEASVVTRSLARVVGKKLDSTEDLRVYSINLEGQSLLAVERAFQDYANKHQPIEAAPERDLIFSIGRMENGHFRVLYWKENTSDENEQVLGLIHMRNGRDFMVDSVSHPEGNFFRIYGVRKGELAVVFEGGGGGC